jgi:hypothetical protein
MLVSSKDGNHNNASELLNMYWIDDTLQMEVVESVIMFFSMQKLVK